jgi:hypothetical protein
MRVSAVAGACEAQRSPPATDSAEAIHEQLGFRIEEGNIFKNIPVIKKPNQKDNDKHPETKANWQPIFSGLGLFFSTLRLPETLLSLYKSG